MGNNMQAMVMTAVGGPEVLQMQSVPRPEISDPHHVLLRVMAAGVNPADLRIRNRMPPITGWDVPPEGIILGLEGAAIVEAVGSAVTRFKEGDAVYYFDGGFVGWPGSYAQFKLIDERYAAKMPTRLSFEQAAALPVVAITAWEALVDRARLTGGDHLLVQGGAGGLGHIAIQIGKLLGAQVAATVSTQAKADLVRDLGADRAILYKDEDVAAAMKDWTGKDGADVIFDTVGDAVLSQSIDLLGTHGRLVTAAYPTSWPTSDIFAAALKNISLSFEAIGHAFRGHSFRMEQARILETVTRHVDDGDLSVVVDRCYPLAEAAEAQRALEAGEITGRVVLKIA